MSIVQRRGTFLFCFFALVLFAAAQNPPRPELTARELFYNASATPAPAAKAPAAKTQAKQTTAKKTVPAAPLTQQASGSSQTPRPSQPSPPEPPIVNASDAPMRISAPAPANGIAMGLKYTVLKLSGNAMIPVAPNSVFHANDKIQFKVETNATGYLYIVSQGSSEKWTALFPSAETAGGNNSVEGFHEYTFPQGYRVVFDEQTGEERLFIIFSREAKPDFEQLVYSLQGKKTAPTNAPRPAEPAGPLLRASIDDSVDHLNQTYARDLVIERIGDEGTAPRADTQEKAVYVVNPTGSSDSVVVADFRLVHR